MAKAGDDVVSWLSAIHVVRRPCDCQCQCSFQAPIQFELKSSRAPKRMTPSSSSVEKLVLQLYMLKAVLDIHVMETSFHIQG